MQRQVLNFNGIPYLIEYRNSNDMSFKTRRKFVMLRKYDIINDIAIDKEIYFVEQEKYINSIVFDTDSKKLFQTDEICYPIHNENSFYISSNILNLMDSSRLSSLFFVEGQNKDYYLLKNKYDEEVDIYCDEIRIYKPHNRNTSNEIIDVSNIVNDIHFHYFCQKMEKQETKISKEIIVNNNRYYEYVSFLIPSLEFLFNQERTYYNEDLNIYHYTENTYNELITPLSNLIMPYSIEKICDKKIDCDDCQLNNTCSKKDFKYSGMEYMKSFIYSDIYSGAYKNSEYNYKNTPLVISLHHYNLTDTSTNVYLSEDGIISSSIEITEKSKFELMSRIDFDKYNQSIISVISEFNYPKLLNNNGKFMSLKEAYFYFNKIDETEYDNFVEYDDDIFINEFSEDFIESLNFNKCGFVIEMSKTMGFDGVFLRKSFGSSCIDDFTFNLNGIFEDWREYPDIIFIRTMFIDKFLSKVFYGPILTLTKEKFKYCINNTYNNYRLLSLKDKQTEINSIYKDMQTENIYFIDKINCSVKKFDINNESPIIIGGKDKKNNAIIYKTVFYKTQDLQNIKIRSTVTQKIGINLGNYLSKVESFKLKLGGYEFVETERNDVYVIFTIPGSQINEIAGIYDIVDQDDEYIDSGNFTLY